MGQDGSDAVTVSQKSFSGAVEPLLEAMSRPNRVALPISNIEELTGASTLSQEFSEGGRR